MSSDLAPIPPPIVPAHPETVTAADLIAHWLAGRSPRTTAAYRGDLEDFARYVSNDPISIDDAVRWLLALGPGPANAHVLGYSHHLTDDRGLASATVARRLAAIRSVVSLANTLGMVAWSIGIRAPRIEARRDVRGPDPADRKRLWKYLRSTGDGRAARRDRAIVALLFDLGLRRGEVAALDVADFVQAPAGELAVVGKGRREAIRLTLPEPTVRALSAWIESRGRDPGPLFGITGEAIRLVLRRIGRAAGLARPLRPHGLRHAAITAALDSGNDIRRVRKFSRHAKLETVLKYDDARDDAAGEIAKGVSRERK